MRMTYRILAVILALAISAVATFSTLSQSFPSSPDSHLPRLPDRFPESIAEVISNATRVESFRVDPGMFEIADTPTFGKLAGHDVLEVGPDLDKQQIERVGELLLSPMGYRPKELTKSCTFVPRHALRFTMTASRPVQALICFECAQISLGNGHDGWWGDCDPIAWRLENIFLELFPSSTDKQARPQPKLTK